MNRSLKRVLSAARRLRASWILLALAAPFVAAETPSAAPPTQIELTVVAGPDLNPNTQGRPSPVVVRIFDLTATPAFDTATFETLFAQAQTLKRDVIAQEELILRPSDIQERNRTLKPGVQALGVAAAFREMDRAVWRLTVPLKAGRRNFLLLHLDRNRIRLETIE